MAWLGANFAGNGLPAILIYIQTNLTAAINHQTPLTMVRRVNIFRSQDLLLPRGLVQIHPHR